MAAGGGGTRPGIPPDEVDDIRRRLRHHDQLYATMQRDSKPFEALEQLEKGLFLRKELLGPDHPEVGKVCQVFTTSCNTLAMNSLQRDNHLLAYELLKKAEILTSPSGYILDKKMRMKLRAVTFNNFGCFYKRRGKLHAALQYLAKALKIELTSEEVDNPAGTHLNLCATLSQLGRHGPALEHAQCAIELLEAMAETREQKGQEGQSAPNGATDDGSILAIAWHNMAVEQEHLGMLEAALTSYQQAVSVAEREWGAGHVKTLAIKYSLDEAHEKLAQARSKTSKGSHAGGGGHGAHSGSPLDAVLNPASTAGHMGGFRQSGIKTHKKVSASPLNKHRGGGGGGGGGRAPNATIRAYTQGPANARAKQSVASDWGEYLSSTIQDGVTDEQAGLPPINRGGGGAHSNLGDSHNAGDLSAASAGRSASDLPDLGPDRRGPRTPSPPPDERLPRPRR